jgi:hypothetical protein
MRRAVLALSAALCLAVAPSWSTAASPQLFKCVEGGRTVYQQVACPLTAQVEAAASGAQPSAKAASEPTRKVASRIRPASPTAPSAPATPR